MGRSQEEPWFICEMISFWILQKFAKTQFQNQKGQTSHLADLNLLNPSSHLLGCNHHVRHLNQRVQTNLTFCLKLLTLTKTLHHLCKHGDCLWKDGHKYRSVRRNFCRAFWGCRHLNIKMSIGYSCFRVGLTSKNYFKIQPWWLTARWCPPKPEVEMGQLSGDEEGECLA